MKKGDVVAVLPTDDVLGDFGAECNGLIGVVKSTRSATQYEVDVEIMTPGYDTVTDDHFYKDELLVVGEL